MKYDFPSLHPSYSQKIHLLNWRFDSKTYERIEDTPRYFFHIFRRHYFEGIISHLHLNRRIIIIEILVNIKDIEIVNLIAFSLVINVHIHKICKGFGWIHLATSDEVHKANIFCYLYDLIEKFCWENHNLWSRIDHICIIWSNLMFFDAHLINFKRILPTQIKGLLQLYRFRLLLFNISEFEIAIITRKTKSDFSIRARYIIKLKPFKENAWRLVFINT